MIEKEQIPHPSYPGSVSMLGNDGMNLYLLPGRRFFNFKGNMPDVVPGQSPNLEQSKERLEMA